MHYSKTFNNQVGDPCSGVAELGLGYQFWINKIRVILAYKWPDSKDFLKGYWITRKMFCFDFILWKIDWAFLYFKKHQKLMIRPFHSKAKIDVNLHIYPKLIINNRSHHFKPFTAPGSCLHLSFSKHWIHQSFERSALTDGVVSHERLK